MYHKYNTFSSQWEEGNLEPVEQSGGNIMK